MSDRYCYVNCGLPGDQCACCRRMLDPMPRPDATLPPPHSLEAVALQARIAALEARADKAEAALADAVKALEVVKADCEGRMPLSRDGRTVPIGAGAWMTLCDTLARLTGDA